MRQKRNKYSLKPKLFVVLIFLISNNFMFAGNKTWNGSTGTDWNVGANWNGGNVPNIGDNAIIPSGLANYPIVTNGTIDIKDINIDGTGSLTITGGTVNAVGELEFLKTTAPYGTVTLSGGTLNVKNLKFAGAGTFIQNENDGISLLTISHDYKNEGGGSFNSTGGTIQFTGSGGRAADFSTGTNQFYNIIVDAGVDPKFDNSGGGIISVAGNFTNNNSSLDVTNSVFTFNGTGDQQISSASTTADVLSTFGTLIIDKPSGTAQLLTDIGVETTFTPVSGTLDQNGKQFYVGGSSTPFPVELVTFSANISDNGIILNWLTATEVNNYGFEVQRSNNADKWDILGFVEGQGNSNSPKEYIYTDAVVSFAGTYYYRLKQIDNDGTYKYSVKIEVDFNSPNDFKLNQNYPNPFNPSTTISFSLPVSGNVSLKIFNALGEEITSLVESFLESGVHTFNFNAEGLTSGLYVYQLSTSNAIQTRKMLYLK